MFSGICITPEQCSLIKGYIKLIFDSDSLHNLPTNKLPLDASIIAAFSCRIFPLILSVDWDVLMNTIINTLSAHDVSFTSVYPLCNRYLHGTYIDKRNFSKVWLFWHQITDYSLRSWICDIKAPPFWKAWCKHSDELILNGPRGSTSGFPRRRWSGGELLSEALPASDSATESAVLRRWPCVGASYHLCAFRCVSP